MRTKSRSESRKLILAQATELFRLRGYYSVTLDDIAKSVNHSKVAIYHYWESKEDLLYEIIRRSHLAVIDAATKILKSNDTPEVKLRKTVENHVMQAVSDVGAPALTGDFRQDIGLTEQHKKSIIKLRMKYDAALRSILEAGIQDGSFTPCETRIVGFTIAGAVSHVRDWYSPEGKLSKEEISNIISTFVMNAVLNRVGGAANRREAGKSSAKK